MPSRWQFSLGTDPRNVQWHQLHGAMSKILHHRDDGATDFALCPPELGPEGSTMVELRVLSDESLLVDRLMMGFEEAGNVGGLLLGPAECQVLVPFRTQLGVANPLSSVEMISWRDLRSRAAPTRKFTMHFLSPYFVRDGNAQLPWPLGASLLRSLHRRWVAHAGELAPPDPRGVKLTVRHFRGETVDTTLDGDGYVGFIGETTYALERGGRAVELDLGRLLAAARFTGVGSMVAYGFGVVDVE